MKKVLFIFMLIAGMAQVPVQAQSTSQSEIMKFLEKELGEKVLEGMKNVRLEDMQMEDVKFRRGKAKIRGQVRVAHKDGKSLANVKFKSKVSTKLSSLGIRYVKVHVPGHSFLGIPLYKRVFKKK
ncbi:MAG: hypothetical protein ACR2MX_03025 [Cyclobacteriaceae bacterium]